jgi:RecB family exonuclease
MTASTFSPLLRGLETHTHDRGLLFLGGARTGKTSALLCAAETLLSSGQLQSGERPLIVSPAWQSVTSTRELLTRNFPHLSGMTRVLTPLSLSHEILRRAQELAMPSGSNRSNGSYRQTISAFDARAAIRQLLREHPSEVTLAFTPRTLERAIDCVLALQASWLGGAEIQTHAEAYVAMFSEHRNDLLDSWMVITEVAEHWQQTQRATNSYDRGGALVAATYALRNATLDQARLREGFRHLLIDDHHRNDFAVHRLLITLTTLNKFTPGSPGAALQTLHVAGDPNGAHWRNHGRNWVRNVVIATYAKETTEPTIDSNKPIIEERVICTHRSLEAEAIVQQVRNELLQGTPIYQIAVVLPPRPDSVLERSLKRTAHRYQLNLGEVDDASEIDPVVEQFDNILRAICNVAFNTDDPEFGHTSRTNEDRQVSNEVHDFVGVNDFKVFVEIARRQEIAATAFAVWERTIAPRLLRQINSASATGFANSSIGSITKYLDAISHETTAQSERVTTAPTTKAQRWFAILNAARSRHLVRPRINTLSTIALLRPEAMQGHAFEMVILCGCVEGQWPSLPATNISLDEALVDGPDALDPTTRHNAMLREQHLRFLDVCARATRRVVAIGAPEPGVLPSRWIESWANAETVVASQTQASAVREPLPESPGVIPVHPTGQLRLSASQLDTFENCPLNYAYQYAAGVRSSGSVQASVGTIVHAALEQFLQPLINEPSLRDSCSEDSLLETLDAVWDSSVFEYRPQDADYRKRAEDWLRMWWEGEWPLIDQMIATEHRFLINVGPHQLAGSIDRISRDVYGRLEIVDYKTGNPNGNGPVEENLQLAAYYLAATTDPELHTHGPPDRLRLHFLANGTDVEQPIAPDHAEVTRQRIRERADKILTEEFAPSLHAECRYCSFARVCPTQPEGREVGTT